MTAIENSINLYREGINSKTLLQVNATIIAGIFVFTSLFSLGILSLTVDTTSIVQRVDEVIHTLQTSMKNTDKDSSSLLSNFSDTEVLSLLNNMSEQIDSIRQNVIDDYKKILNHLDTIGKTKQIFTSYQEIGINYFFSYIMLFPFIFSSIYLITGNIKRAKILTKIGFITILVVFLIIFAIHSFIAYKLITETNSL